MSNKAHIYGHLVSPPSRTIKAFCDLSNIPYEFHVIDLGKGDHLTEDFTKINPFQTIPACVVGDFNAWESCAIVPYLADAFRVNNSWYPKDPKVRVRVDSYLHYHGGNIKGPIAGYSGPKGMYPKLMGTPELTPEAEAPLREKFFNGLETLKWLISETGFVARTSHATVADIFAYSEIAQTGFLGFDLRPHREIYDWFNRIGAHQPIVAAHEMMNQIVRQYYP
jgi:glutathione S-transferase